MTDERSTTGSETSEDPSTPTSTPQMSLFDRVTRERTPSEEAELTAIMDEARRKGQARLDAGYERVVTVVPSPCPPTSPVESTIVSPDGTLFEPPK